MQIKCLYCDSLIETEGITNCPCCCAPISESYEEAQKIEEEKLKAEQEARKAEMQEAQEQQNKEDLIKGIASIAGGLLGVGALSNRTRNRMPYGNQHGGPGGFGGPGGGFGGPGGGHGGPGGFGGPGGGHGGHGGPGGR